jgi:hypothetical protein
LERGSRVKGKKGQKRKEEDRDRERGEGSKREPVETSLVGSRKSSLLQDS